MLLRTIAPVGVSLGLLAALGGGRRAMSGPTTSPALLDRRQFAKLSAKAAPHTRRRKNQPYALVLHQMGFSRGNNPARYDRVTAHYKILPDGRILWSWDDDVRLPAAGGLNHGSWSVEFAGNFPAQPGSSNPGDFYRPLPFEYVDDQGKTRKHPGFGMDQLTDPQARAGRWLVDHLIPRGLTTILAHRQGGPERQNDPGPDVWYRVGEWAVRERGLDWGGPAFAVAGGSPIPTIWRTWGDPLGGPDVPAKVA